MSGLQRFVAYIGRVFLGVIFLLSSIVELANWSGTEQFLLMRLTRWVHYYQDSEGVSAMFTEILPWVPILLVFAVVLKLLGSICLMVGWQVRLGAAFLVAFILPVTILMHDFWNLTGEESSIELVMFFKNLSILGGLLVVLAFGKGQSKASS